MTIIMSFEMLMVVFATVVRIRTWAKTPARRPVAAEAE
jgi:hypothetical protein